MFYLFIQNVLKKDPSSSQVREGLALALGAVVYTYCKTPGYCQHQVRIVTKLPNIHFDHFIFFVIRNVQNIQQFYSLTFIPTCISYKLFPFMEAHKHTIACFEGKVYNSLPLCSMSAFLYHKFFT